MAYRWMLGLFAALSLGCFTDLDETSGSCPDGASGCSCYGNGTCDDNLICNADSNCVSQDCEDGRAECPCYGNGTCDAGLTCTDNICQPAANTGSATSGTSSATSTTNSSVGPTSNASMTSVGVSGVFDSSSTFVGGVSSFPGETGPVFCDCGPAQACLPDGGCRPNPYVPCLGGDACPGEGACVSRAAGENVCAPPCMEDFECPTLPDVFILPICAENVCVLPCAIAEECPGALTECLTSPVGVQHCLASGLGPR